MMKAFSVSWKPMDKLFIEVESKQAKQTQNNTSADNCKTSRIERQASKQASKQAEQH
jgi:hypothetical protein